MTPAEVRELFAFNAWASRRIFDGVGQLAPVDYLRDLKSSHGGIHGTRSEEHTSELQSPCNLVCRLLLEKKNKGPGSYRIQSTLGLRFPIATDGQGERGRVPSPE